MRRVNEAVFWLSLTLGSSVLAEPDDPLALADPISAIGVARVADEVGDERLVLWLGPSARRDQSLWAVRAAAYATAPERLVSALMPHVCGRDPVLAPEAGLTLVQIAERLKASELSQREVLLSDLRSAKAALGCTTERADVRADLKAASQLLDARLGSLLEAR